MARLSGKWLFKEQLPAGQLYSIEQELGFTVYAIMGGVVGRLYTCSKIAATNITMTYDVVSAVPESDEDSLAVYMFWPDSDLDGWFSFWNAGIRLITITEEQEVSDEFYEWFIQAADPVDGTLILYKGGVVSTLAAGITSIVTCGGYRMEAPIVVDVADGAVATISYNGAELARLDSGQRAVLACGGCWMKGHVYVVVSKKE